jgi:hypothetical protein
MVPAPQVAGLLWVLPEPYVDKLVFDRRKNWLARTLETLGHSAVGIVLEHDQALRPRLIFICR